jgi:hypothetical protein
MKQIHSDGKKLTVRDLGPVLYEMTAKIKEWPLPIHTYQRMSDNEARRLIQDLKNTGNYDGGKIDG